MLSKWLLSISMLLASPVWAQGSAARVNDDESPWSTRWKMRLAGSSQESDEQSSKLVNFRFDLGFRYQFNEDLLLKVTPSARLQSGSVQTAQLENRPTNSLLMKEASLTGRLVGPLLLKGGALSEDEIHTPLVVGDRAFPAVRSILMFGDREFRYGVQAEMALPTVVGFTDNQGQKEETPTLTTAGIRMYRAGSRGVNFDLKANYFEYRDLGGSLSNESGLLGNTIDRVSDSLSSFRYQYRGVEADASIVVPVGSMDLRLQARAAQNTEAPAGRNSAWSGGGGLGLRLGARTQLLLSGETYRIESDAAVASYILQDYSSTNRQGYAVESGVAFDRGRYRLIGRFDQSDLIFVNSPQSREQFIQLRLETSYADF